ncbi:C1-like protein [Artemisia annua]|uniref:C1-like protein n=1 Tax=Artemisia annua TaxID=35608 RepID=A0A2U1KB25_ARTAN|nr:C1-like protein [Artemisia annua]
MAPLQKSNSVNQADLLQIQHFTHPCMLHKVFMTSEFNCDGCNTGGHGVRYRCSACDFDLHEKCATTPHRTISHLHPQHQLLLVNRPNDSHFCNVCRGFTNGLSYTCECPTCEFDVHVLCIEIPVAKGVPSTLDRSQSVIGMSWGQPATTVGGFNGVGNSQPVMMNGFPHQNQQQHHQQPMQKQVIPMTASNGYNGMNNIQPMTLNHHQQQPGMPTTAFVGYNGANTNQQMMINPQMMVHPQPQQQQFYNNKMISTNQPLMPNQQLQQFGGYPGVNTNQMMMIPQQQPMPMTMYGGYNVVNNNQNMMTNQHKQQPQPGGSSNYAKVGKVAANILTTSLIGIPIFSTRR